MKQNELRRAMDAHLPGVTGPGFEQAVLHRIRAEKPRSMPRKGLALAIALAVLLTLSATAAAAVLLSAREVVEEHALPMSSETPGEAFTLEQTKALVALAEENGLLLSENARLHLEKLYTAGEGQYKDELLRAIAKAEFGPDPAAWTLEQQSWFDDVCVAIGLLPEKVLYLPEKGEDGRAWAIALAKDHIRTAHGDLTDVTDPRVYEAPGVQYINGDADGEFPGMYWSVCFVPCKGTEAALSAAEYWVYLSDNGHVLDSIRRPGAESGVHTMWVKDAYDRCYGQDRSLWPQGAWRGYREAMLACIQTPEDKLEQLCLDMSSWPDLAENAIPREEAVRIALASAEDGAEVRSSVYLGTGHAPVWQIGLRLADGTLHIILVDSVTGGVLSRQPCPDKDALWYLPSVWEEAEALYLQYLDTLPGNG